MLYQVWPENVLEFIQTKNCFVMDVREESEFRKGHLPKAVHVEEEEIVSGEFTLSKKIPVLVYCDEGSRSIQIARQLIMKGYRVYNLAGGYEAYLRHQKS